jgi:serine/threonine-protein kinase HipA
MKTEIIDVAFLLAPERRIPVGRLALDGNIAVFEYDAAFPESGLSLNPMFGAPQTGLLRPRDPRSFRGLHGVFADSLPDAWGRLLLERRLRQAGVAPEALSVLDRLALVGDRGRGALVYEPALHDAAADGSVNLERLARQADEVLEGDERAVLIELEKLGGSSGGARPKVHVALDDAGHARSEEHRLPPGFSSWIVKFRSRADRFSDIGPLEAAYAEAARRARIEMPRTRLIQARKGPGFFATERFDRGPDGTRYHMLSIAGMLDADWTLPSIDYEALLNAVRGATRNEQAVFQMFRRMTFNVLAVNRDDHTQQHALLLDRNARWRLSPAYDLTFSSGPGNEHYLAVNGRGREITRADLLAVAHTQSLDKHRANATIDEVSAAIARLPSIASDFGVTRATLAEMKRATEEQLVRIERK